MTRYYTDEARQSAVNKITKLIEVVATAPGNVIDYLDAKAIIDILAERREDLEKEINSK